LFPQVPNLFELFHVLGDHTVDDLIASMIKQLEHFVEIGIFLLAFGFFSTKA
jgi:hypothetical protein